MSEQEQIQSNSSNTYLSNKDTGIISGQDSESNTVIPTEVSQATEHKPSSKTMEVHHHTHHPKKWKEYFWEFFMLFLAVFCGFLAEIQVEHYVEHQREKQYIKTLIEDLDVDSARITSAIKRSNMIIGECDSLLIMYLNKDHLKAQLVGRFTVKAYIAATFIDFNFSDRTSSQLKGSGSLRLIRNKSVTDSILLYWDRQDRLRIVSDRYESFRIESRKIGWKVFDWYPFNFSSVKSSATKVFPDLYKETRINSSEHLKEYMNVISSCYSTIKPNLLGQLEAAFRQNRNLSRLIKNAYNL
jgi:hypothetical protein